MLSLHNIKRIRARASETNSDSNWVELHIEGGYVHGDPEQFVLNLYFNSPELARAFYEAYPDKLTEAERHADRFWGRNQTEELSEREPTCVACGTTYADHDEDCPQFDSERK